MTMGVYTKVVGELLDQAESEIKDSGISAAERATSMLMMKNLLLEIKPRLLGSKDLAKHVCKIADKKIKIPKLIKRDNQLNTMIKGVSPSDLAKRIMYWYADQKNKDVQANAKGCPFSKKG